ncbi:MAG: hypothetical protein MHM6MM_004319 [Cercozoa sp. M6MM]
MSGSEKSTASSAGIHIKVDNLGAIPRRLSSLDPQFEGNPDLFDHKLRRRYTGNTSPSSSASNVTGKLSLAPQNQVVESQAVEIVKQPGARELRNVLETLDIHSKGRPGSTRFSSSMESRRSAVRHRSMPLSRHRAVQKLERACEAGMDPKQLLFRDSSLSSLRSLQLERKATVHRPRRPTPLAQARSGLGRSASTLKHFARRISFAMSNVLGERDPSEFFALTEFRKKRRDAFRKGLTSPDLVESPEVTKALALYDTGTAAGVLEIEPAKEPHPKAKKLLATTWFKILTVLATFFALFGSDVFLLSFDSSADIYLDVITLAVFAVMGFEIYMLSLATENYRWGTFFWLDTLATLSLLADVGVLTTALFGSSLSLARAGTRLGRLVKLTRLVRLSRFIRMRNMSSENDEENHRVIRDEKHAADISQKIAHQITAKVIVVLLVVLFTLPFLEASGTTDASTLIEAQLTSLHGAVGTPFYDELYEDFLLNELPLMYLRVGDIVSLDLPRDQLRRTEKITIAVPPNTVDLDEADAVAIFNSRSDAKHEALMSIMTVWYTD